MGLLGVLLYVRWKTRQADHRQDVLLQELKALQFRLEQGEAAARQVTANVGRRDAEGTAGPPILAEPPDEFVRRCAAQEAVLVLGFGVGANAGFPTWRGALDQLIEEASGDPHLRDEMRAWRRC